MPAYLNINKDENFSNLVSGKRVAYVGPSPHIMGSGLGSVIDSYDLVIRINETIPDPVDYGSRTDILVHNLNNCYGPILGEFLKEEENRKGIKYIVVGENCKIKEGETNWRMPDTEANYKQYVSQYDIPLYIIDPVLRGNIANEIKGKAYVENGVHSNSSFNNGYAGLLMILNYPVQEIFITGLNFYNYGKAYGFRIDNKEVDEITEEENKGLKYHKNYTKYLEAADHIDYRGKRNFLNLHDQLAQARYFRDIVVPNHTDTMKLDDNLLNNLFTEELNDRFKWHDTLEA